MTKTKETAWLKPPDGGAPREVEVTPEALSPLMKDGWTQCAPPAPVAPAKEK
jgi:hypothetical protein